MVDEDGDGSGVASLAATLAFAAFFIALDHVLMWTLQPWLAQLALNDKQQRPGRGRVVAAQAVAKMVNTAFNCVQIPLALLVLLDPVMHADRLHARSGPSLLMLQLASGFFLQDVVNCIRRCSTEGPLFLVHAACCFIVFFYASMTSMLHYYGAAFLLWECSTFNVHLRWLLIKLGHGTGRAFLANGIAMIAVFFCCRILWGFHCSAQFYTDTRAELGRAPGPRVLPPPVIHLFLAANVALNSLNTWWFSLMLRGAAQALRGRDMAEAGRARSD